MIPDSAEKRRLYQQAKDQIHALIACEKDHLARLSGALAVLHGLMPHFYWTGFYRVVGEFLVVGPYQGTPACARIQRGKGVCGVCWETGETQIVADVDAFPGHIACDPASASEIVIPVQNSQGETVAVLDIDSQESAAFDLEDQLGLERILEIVWSAPTCD